MWFVTAGMHGVVDRLEAWKAQLEAKRQVQLSFSQAEGANDIEGIQC